MRHIANIIKYIAVFVLNTLILLFVHSYFNFVIMFIMLVLPVASIICTVVTLNSLTVSFDGGKDRLTVCEPFLMSVVLSNRCVFPNMNVNININLANALFGISGKHSLCIPAYSRGTDIVDYKLEQRYVGVLTATAESIAITDWLGFITIKRECNASREYVVFPKDELAAEPDMAAMSTGMTESEESNRKGNDFSDVTDVREYRPGDKLQSIHWKLSAKRDMLMVKERTSMSSSRLIVLMELVNDASGVLNDIIKASYGLAIYLMSHQVPFTIYCWSTAMQDLIKCDAETKESLDEWLETVFYQKTYDEPKLGFNMVSRMMNSDKKFLVIGKSGQTGGEPVFTYGSQVEGCICE